MNLAGTEVADKMEIMLVTIAVLAGGGLAFYRRGRRQAETGSTKPEKMPAAANSGKTEAEKAVSGSLEGICAALEKGSPLTEELRQQLSAYGPGQMASFLADWSAFPSPAQRELRDFWLEAGFTAATVADLATKKEEDRLMTASLLTRLGDVRIIPLLLAALEKPEQFLPARVGEVLLAFGPQALEPLLRDIGCLSAKALPLVVDILAEMADERAIPALAGLVRHPQGEIRQKAAVALGEIGSSQGTAALIGALSDGEWSVRSRAAKALGQIGDPASVPALERALTDEAWWVQTNAREALDLILGSGADSKA